MLPPPQLLLTSLEGTTGYILLLFLVEDWELSSFVLLEIYRLGNLYLCGRELDRLHGPSDISIIIRHGRTQLDLEGQYHLTW